MAASAGSTYSPGYRLHLKRKLTTMNQNPEYKYILDDRPDRTNIIEKDEIIGLIIDLETLSPIDFYKKYFDE
jgi:hypothetical protein